MARGYNKESTGKGVRTDRVRKRSISYLFVSAFVFLFYRKGRKEEMMYSKDEVMQFVEEEDVKFIRMAFCDIYGRQKNISIMPKELERAFEYGIAIDASAVEGFGGEVYSDLLLRPDSSTCLLYTSRCV